MTTRTQKAKRRNAEIERVEQALAGKIICGTCGATIDTWADKCTADLTDWCDGFITVELTYHPDGRTVPSDIPREQVERCRAISQSAPGANENRT